MASSSASSASRDAPPDLGADPTVWGPVSVSVDAGDRAWILVHSQDGEELDALVVPLAD